MDFEEIAIEILDIAEKIFQLNEQEDLEIIFGDKIFYISKNADGLKSVSARPDYENQDREYYFELPDIAGVILKNKNNGNYAIKARVCYLDRKGQKWAFAKVRISLGFNGKIQIGGERSGSWQKSDYHDTDFLQNPDSELNLVLESLKRNLNFLWEELHKKGVNVNETFIPKWFRELKQYNGQNRS